MLLKNFVDDKGYLHVFNKKKNKIYSTKPDNLFVKKHLYREWSFKESAYNQENEERISKIESEATPVIQRIVECARKNKTPKLSPDQSDNWKRFYVSLGWRVPEFADKTMRVDKQLEGILRREVKKVLAQREEIPPDISSALQNPINIAGVQAITDKLRARLAAINHPVSIKDVEWLSSHAGLGIAVISIQNRSFVIGSHCFSVLKYSGKNNQVYGNWLPIAHDVAICPTSHPDQEGLVQLTTNMDRTIKKINETSFCQSDIIAGKSRVLVRSLAKRYSNR